MEEDEDDDDLGGFFDTECRVGNNEDEDEEPFEEVLTDLFFLDLECRQENGTHEPNLCVVQNEADFPRRYDEKGLLRMVIHRRSYWVHRDGA